MCNYYKGLKHSSADRCANLAIYGQVTYEPTLKSKGQMNGSVLSAAVYISNYGVRIVDE